MVFITIVLSYILKSRMKGCPEFLIFRIALVRIVFPILHWSFSRKLIELQNFIVSELRLRKKNIERVLSFVVSGMYIKP